MFIDSVCILLDVTLWCTVSGDVIGMEVNGDNVLDLSKQILETCCRNYLYYLSDSASAGNQDIDAFFNFNDVGMGGL